MTARLVLLLPTGTYRAADFVDAAASLGAEVVVASERRQALARSMGDRAVVVDWSRPERAADAVVELASRSPVDGIVAVDDQGVLVAALAGERLGLAHNPAVSVARTRDKAAMREALAAGGVPQPDWAVAAPGQDVGEVAREVGMPCVVKPTGLSASRGVIRADTVEDARAAAARARAIAGGDDSTLVVERFVPGGEVAVEGLLRGGRLEVLAVFDKPDPLDGPYFEETIYVTPSRLPGAILAEVRSVTARACGALGLAEGPVHAELRVAGRPGAGAGPVPWPADGSETGQGPGSVPGSLPGSGPAVRVIEVAARSIGGLCSRTLRFGTGISLEQVIVAHALGRPLEDLSREEGAAGVMMLPIPAAGTLEGVGGQEAARAVPGITALEVSIPPGRPVVPLPEGDRYLGFLFARGPAPAGVEAALRRAHSLLEVRIRPAEG